MKPILKTALIIAIVYVLYETSFWVELLHSDKRVTYKVLRSVGHFILSIPLGKYYRLKGERGLNK